MVDIVAAMIPGAEDDVLYLEDGEMKRIPREQAIELGWLPPLPVLPEPVEIPRRFSKRSLFGSLTDQEYEVWEYMESQQPRRLQRVLREATELNEADDDFPDLYMAMVAAYGQERADEVLEKARLA